MSTTVPVPAWLFIAFIVLATVREYFLFRRDEAIRDLWKMYLRASQSEGQP